ncbi:MAG: Transposase for transposon Tn5 [Phycisphaerae bacterium]|nr:Transposase for transposon Tn5 [Phycisphaerae bacterium]
MDRPPGVEGLEWILLTTLPCETDEELELASRGYALRWMIEEFHKCEKTGCQVEMRRLEHTDRLEPLIGLLSVMAVWLLQLKYVVEDAPDAPAQEYLDPPRVRVMAAHLKQQAATLTVKEFRRGIGLLGGHLGRKSDGKLGWLRAWKGWRAFPFILLGAELAREHQ